MNDPFFQVLQILDEQEVPSAGRQMCVVPQFVATVRGCTEAEAITWLERNGDRMYDKNDEFMGLWLLECP